MVFRLVTAPAIEPITIGEAMAWGRIDTSNQEPAPGAVTVALANPAAAGNVDNGAHRYLATFVTADGETEAGVESVAATVTDKTANGKVELTAIPIGGALVTARKLYRTAAGGSAYKLLATIANNTATTYTDNIADSSLGAGAPSANTTSDAKFRMMIAGARKAAENRTGRALITQTWELLLDGFPRGDIEVGKLPIQSVTSVKCYDPSGVLQTLDPLTYVLDTDALPGWIRLAYGKEWPDTQAIENAVVVRFIAGYGSASSSVPENIRMWIGAQVTALFDNPSPLAGGNANPVTMIDHLLDDYRIRFLA